MKRLLLGLLVLCAGCKPAACLVTGGLGCASTVEAAVARLIVTDTSLVKEVSRNGFRVVSLRSDKLHNKRYALVASCADAARPLVSVDVSGLEASVKSSFVHLGDRVKVLSSQENSRMELIGRAEGNGAAGEVVRVQLPKFSDDPGASRIIQCRVVGLNVVEVLP